MKTLLANPVLTSELRGRIRGLRTMIILTIYLSITGIVTLLIYLAVASTMSFTASDFETGRNIGKAIFLTVMAAALVQVCIIIPALTSGSIAGEKERQTYELLIATLLSPWQIALGKLMAALAFASLLIIAVLPVAGLAFLFGGVSATELVIALIGLLMTAVLYATVGLFWSTVMRSTLGATVISLGTIILALLGIPFLFVISGVIVSNVSRQGDPFALPLFAYGIGMLIYTHPFIALGHTAILLYNGESPFYFTFNAAGSEMFAPSPWLAYSALAGILTLLFMFLSVRRIKPLRQERPRRKVREE
jgi:ABC-type transport system involved in multi-copper enzyme maturation permease subunit